MSSPTAERSRVPLSPRERRVLGVLVEKAKTTPEYYPMTVAAIVTGCNQKSNRDPVTNYDADDVEEILQDLRRKSAVIMVETGGRVVRWKHTLYDWLKVSKVELAVLAELMLRGPQTEGDLRARASRMEPLPELASLQAVLEALVPRDLVIYLSPPGQKRGVVVTHGLYPPAELEKVRQAFAQQAVAAAEDEERPARPAPARAELSAAAQAPAWAAEVAALRSEVAALRGTVEALAAEVRGLKAALGA
ncbi:MAG: YceH family protein [Planctomycetaceae bacterium]